MKLSILGCRSATPSENYHTTSQVLELKNHLFLIDCGEGTQIQLRNHKIKFSRIKHIFISHLHGDHFYGLIGLISTFRLLGRTSDLYIYGPKGIKEVITLQLKLANSWTNYSLFFHELESNFSQVIFEDDEVSVSTIPLDHRIYTNGFLFKEKIKQKRLNRITTNDLKIESHSLKTYAFCSDTAYNENIIPFIKSVDLLYHDATFLDLHENLAKRTKHSTAKQAAKIAKLAEVKKLVLGHFSSRYKDKKQFLSESKLLFHEVELASDGKVIEI